ncbi:MAG: PEGA domain-containing protein [bacterium]|nr:PEGA domain-containing protein [bacterium]
MTNILTSLRNRTTIIMIIVFFLALIVVSSLFLFSSPKTIKQKIVPSPSPQSVSQSQYYSQLTPEEKRYPEAPPQISFSTGQNSETGLLLITSNPEGARVIIDVPENETNGTGSAPISPVPIKTTPFKVSQIPAGEHNLTAHKQGYIYNSINFKIEANKINRVHFELQPLPSQ